MTESIKSPVPIYIVLGDEGLGLSRRVLPSTQPVIVGTFPGDQVYTIVQNISLDVAFIFNPSDISESNNVVVSRTFNTVFPENIPPEKIQFLSELPEHFPLNARILQFQTSGRVFVAIIA